MEFSTYNCSGFLGHYKTIQGIDDLDTRKKWVDWVVRFGKEIKNNVNTKAHETIQGLMKELVDHSVMGTNRDNETKQIGHKTNMYFQLHIVKDQLSWNDESSSV